MIQQPDKAVGGNIPNLVLIKPVQDIQIIKDRKTSRNYIIIETYDIWEKYIKPLQEIDICHNKYNQYELIEDEYNYWHSRYNAGLTFTTSNGLKVFFYPLYEKNLPVSIPSGKAKLIYLFNDQEKINEEQQRINSMKMGSEREQAHNDLEKEKEKSTILDRYFTTKFNIFIF